MAKGMMESRVGLVALALTICGVASVATDGRDPAQEKSAAEEMLRLGEQMYRQGVLPNGTPMQAIVAGEVPVDGRMFTCVNCHQRSGLGSVEGAVIAWPTNGKELFVPRRRTGAWNPSVASQSPGSAERRSIPLQYQSADERPAYTEETLSSLIRDGVDPTGRRLNRVMPRYAMSDSDMVALIHYLRNLSVDTDPGVDESTIRFATVVTEGVPEEDREAMLSVLRAHIDARNTQTRPHERRSRLGPFFKTEQYGAYRKLELDVWELKGPVATWRSQLEAHYETRPVFALLGGISRASWEPVHEFCEDNEIPSIFPITDRPVISDSDWYTLYFSKGLYQEGEAAAKFLRISSELEEDARIVQVYRSGERGEDAARGFRQTWEEGGELGLESRPLEAKEDLSMPSWLGRPGDPPPDAVLLWLEEEDLATAFAGPLAGTNEIKVILASSSLMGSDRAIVPKPMRTRFFLTYPHSLVDKESRSQLALTRWMKAREIPATDLNIQAKMYVLGWMLPGALAHMRSEFFRDYFLEGYDMMIDQDYAVPNYPRLSFGPGQRYASKGCYIVQLTSGDDPELVQVSEWVIN